MGSIYVHAHLYIIRMYLATLSQLRFTGAPKRPALETYDVPFSNVDNKRIQLRPVIDTTKVKDYGRFKQEMLDPLPITTYEEWCAYKPSVVPTYTKYVADGSVTLTEIQKEDLLSALVQKVTWLLDRYKDFVGQNPNVRIVRKIRKGRENSIAYVMRGKNTVYINSCHVYEYSDERIFDLILHEIAHIVREHWFIRQHGVLSMFGSNEYSGHDVYWQLIHQRMGGSGLEKASNEWSKYHVPKRFIDEGPYVYFMCVDAAGYKGGCYKNEHIPNDDGADNYNTFKWMLENADVTSDGKIVCKEECELHPGNRYQLIIPDWFRSQYRGKESDAYIANVYKRYMLDIPSLENIDD